MDGFSCGGGRCRAFTVIEGEYEIVDEAPAALPAPNAEDRAIRARLLLATRAAQQPEQPQPAADLPSIPQEQWDAEVQSLRISAELARANSEKRRALRQALAKAAQKGKL